MKTVTKTRKAPPAKPSPITVECKSEFIFQVSLLRDGKPLSEADADKWIEEKLNDYVQEHLEWGWDSLNIDYDEKTGVLFIGLDDMSKTFYKLLTGEE